MLAFCAWSTYNDDVNNKPYLIVNWNTLDQALGPNSTEADVEAFASAARSYAAQQGWGFDTIRDIQQPGFFLSTDGETRDNDMSDLEESVFESILVTM